jgi:SSS family solute:Na+ symporter
VATVFGASSTLGIIGLGYSRGLTAAWWSLIGACALLAFGLTLASRVRALKVYTLPDILRRAYGRGVSAPAAVMIVIAWCGVVSAQMQAGARLLSAVLPFDYSIALTATAAVFVLYTFWGGQLSVIRTDAWQLTLFVGGLLACVVLAAVSLRTAAPAALGSLPAGHLQFPVSHEFGWYQLLIFYPLIVGLPYLAGPDIYSRMLCARHNDTARRSALIAAAAVVPVSFVLALLGLLARAQIPDVPPDAALPALLSELAPIGLAGLITTGFLAAVMSSADTTLVSAATIFSLNVVGARNNVTHSRQLKWTRSSVLGLGLVAWLIAWSQPGIIASLVLAYTVFVGGVVAPTLASFYRNQLAVTASGAMWAVIVGGGSALIGVIRDGSIMRSLLGTSGSAFFERVLGPGYPNILPILLSVITLVGVSRLVTSRSSRDVTGQE